MSSRVQPKGYEDLFNWQVWVARYHSTQAPLHRHHYTGTTAQAPLHRHRYTGTATQAPLHRHHYTGTTTQAPLHRHHYTGKVHCAHILPHMSVSYVVPNWPAETPENYESIKC